MTRAAFTRHLRMINAVSASFTTGEPEHRLLSEQPLNAGAGHAPGSATSDGSGTDGREPDYSRSGIFRDHNCYRCQDGRKPCVNGKPNLCEYPHARND